MRDEYASWRLQEGVAEPSETTDPAHLVLAVGSPPLSQRAPLERPGSPSLR